MVKIIGEKGMKQLRIGFKSCQKFIKRFNAHFHKISAGVFTYHNSNINRNKTRPSQQIQSGKHPKK